MAVLREIAVASASQSCEMKRGYIMDINLYFYLLGKLTEHLTDLYRKLDFETRKMCRASDLRNHFMTRDFTLYLRASRLHGWIKGGVECIKIEIRIYEDQMNEYRAKVEELGDQW